MAVPLFIGLALLCMCVGTNLGELEDNSVVVAPNVEGFEDKSTPSSVSDDEGSIHGRSDDEEKEYHEVDDDLNAQLFLNDSHAYGFLRGLPNIRGLAVLDCSLFVVRNASNKVTVYNTNTLAFIRSIKITGAKDLRAIVASAQSNSVYVSDPQTKRIYQYCLTDKVIKTSWSVGGECHGLSLTSDHNILVSLQDLKQINEYSGDGSLVKEISLDKSHTFLWQSIQLSSGQFVICHGVRKEVLHRVCIEDTSGEINKCYGGSPGRSVEKFNGPTNLAVDLHDNVLVADFNNNRVVLLSANFTHLGNVNIPGHTLNGPWALHLDRLTRRLYIGEFFTGRIIVLTV